MSYELKAYKLINLIFAGIVLCIFIYSGIFSAEKANHPIPSFYTKITGQESISTGLSRSFSSIMRLDFQKAKAFNRYGISIFLFFLIQFFMRLLHYWLSGKQFITLPKQVIVDSIVSLILFIYFFLPFIGDLFAL